jgi:hypothetical protein
MFSCVDWSSGLHRIINRATKAMKYVNARAADKRKSYSAAWVYTNA